FPITGRKWASRPLARPSPLPVANGRGACFYDVIGNSQISEWPTIHPVAGRSVFRIELQTKLMPRHGAMLDLVALEARRRRVGASALDQTLLERPYRAVMAEQASVPHSAEPTHLVQPGPFPRLTIHFTQPSGPRGAQEFLRQSRWWPFCCISRLVSTAVAS